MKPANSSTKHHVLTVSCPGHIGTVAAISAFFAERNHDIVQLQQFNDLLLPGRGFFMRIEFLSDPAGNSNLDDLRSEFKAIAKDYELNWDFYDASIRPRILIMVSKFDHCLVDLLYRWKNGELEMDIPAIVSNHPDLEHLAQNYGIPYYHLPVTADTKPQQEARLLELIKETKTDCVVLARYMQVLSGDLCGKLRNKAINIHHSFLPGFKGAKPYHQAHERGVKLIGATAHYVTDDLDEGPIIEQMVERVNHTSQPHQLAAAGRETEKHALARAVKYHIEHRVFVVGNKTVVFE